MKGVLTCIFTSLLILTGCASNKLSVTYYSDPPGATIIQANGQNFGRAPITLDYTISAEERKAGGTQVMGVTAQWISGAKVGYQTLRLGIGRHQSYTLRRPADAPGLSTDLTYALELEKLAEMQKQTQAQRDAAWEASRAADAAEASAKANKQKPSSTIINCFGTGLTRTCM